MSKLNIRPIKTTDLKYIEEIDPSYHTEYVWQMDFNPDDKELNVRFREIRLPRSMLVAYPYSTASLTENWKHYESILVAELETELIAYICLTKSRPIGTIAVTDLVVRRKYRRDGTASSLLRAAQSWAINAGYEHLVVEMQSKNFPAIEMVSKLGFEFCGYSDKYYPNQDIALFFAKRI